MSQNTPPIDDVKLEALELEPCPFCGERLICDPNEGAPFWVHRNRLKIDCWLADAWVKDELEGEGGILEWNTRPHADTLSLPTRDTVIEELRELSDKATAGPWRRADWQVDGGPNRWTIEASGEREESRPGYTSVWPDGIPKIRVASVEDGSNPDADGDFIVAAVNMVRAALSSTPPESMSTGQGEADQNARAMEIVREDFRAHGFNESEIDCYLEGAPSDGGRVPYAPAHAMLRVAIAALKESSR